MNKRENAVKKGCIEKAAKNEKNMSKNQLYQIHKKMNLIISKIKINFQSQHKHSTVDSLTL